MATLHIIVIITEMKKAQRKWKKISSKLIYQNPWIKVWEDKVIRPDGKKGIYGFLEKPTGVFVIPYSPENKSIFLLQQNRYPIKKVIYEIPAGVITTKNYLAEAKRELFEETGFRTKKWKYLGHFFVAPGHETTDIKAYLAEINEVYDKKSNQEGDEAIQKIIEIEVKDLPNMIRQGKIECGITLASLYLFFLQQKIA